MSGLTINHYLILSALLFSAGVLAVTLRRNAIGILIGIELMLNAANINLVAFSRYLGNHVDGAVYAIFVIMLAAAEAAVAIAIVLNVFHHAASISVDDYTEVGASLGWNFTENLGVTLDASNLTNETYFQYLGTEDYLAGKYSTGRRYMLTLRAGF